MTIEIRNQKFRAAVHHAGKRYRKTFDTREDALRWETEMKLKALDGRELTSKVSVNRTDLPETLGELIAYTDEHEWRDCKSRKNLKQNAMMVAEIIGMDTPVKSIDRLDLDGAVSRFVEQGNSNATINRKMAAISKVLNTAVSLGVIHAKPNAKRLREKPHRLRWYTRDELLAINKAAKTLDMQAFGNFLRFLALTGLRLSEALNIRWSDVSDDSICIRDSKSGESRHVPMCPAVMTMMQHYRDWKVGPWSWLTKHKVRTMWHAVKREANLGHDDEALIHTFRHTFVSHLVQKGVPITVVRELAGHKTIEMTLRYAHLAPRDLQAAVLQLTY